VGQLFTARFCEEKHLKASRVGSCASRGPLADETRKKISATKKGNTFISKEHRLRISASLKKYVVITLLEKSVEIVCPSVNDAAKEMGVSRQTIGNLATNKTRNSTCKGGDYAGQLFEARFRDE
jgi:predicted DNA-binding protein (UPF0251 family)